MNMHNHPAPRTTALAVDRASPVPPGPGSSGQITSCQLPPKIHPAAAAHDGRLVTERVRSRARRPAVRRGNRTRRLYCGGRTEGLFGAQVGGGYQLARKIDRDPDWKPWVT